MSTRPHPQQALDHSVRDMFTPRRIALRIGITAAVAAALVMARGGFAQLPAMHLHAPHFGLIGQQSFAIKLHIAAAVVALVSGGVLMSGLKGTTLHRRLGWAWVVAMATVAGSSFFIRVINPGHWSFIHFVSGWVTISLPIAIVAIRRRNVRLHRRLMGGLFIGGLLIAGAFTFFPGRLMFEVFFG